MYKNKNQNHNSYFNAIPSFVHPNKKRKTNNEFDQNSYVIYPDPDQNIGEEVEEEEDIPVYESSPPNGFVPNFIPGSPVKEDVPFENPFGTNSFGSNPFGSEDDLTKKIIRKPCLLPMDQKKFDREEKENDEYGLEIMEECELCRIVDGNLITSNECSKTLKQLMDLMNKCRRSTGTFTLYDRVSKIYNQRIYDKLRNRQTNLKPWNSAIVRYHDQFCDRKDIKKTLYEDLDYIEQEQLYLRRSGMFDKITSLDGNEVIELDVRKQKQWEGMLNSKLKILRFLYGIERNEEKTKIGFTNIAKKDTNGSLFSLY